jgi:hypothetical protein
MSALTSKAWILAEFLVYFASNMVIMLLLFARHFELLCASLISSSILCHGIDSTVKFGVMEKREFDVVISILLLLFRSFKPWWPEILTRKDTAVMRF